jgi:hypothetical protein
MWSSKIDQNHKKVTEELFGRLISYPSDWPPLTAIDLLTSPPIGGTFFCISKMAFVSFQDGSNPMSQEILFYLVPRSRKKASLWTRMDCKAAERVRDAVPNDRTLFWHRARIIIPTSLELPVHLSFKSHSLAASWQTAPAALNLHPSQHPPVEQSEVDLNLQLVVQHGSTVGHSWMWIHVHILGSHSHTDFLSCGVIQM